MTVTFEKRKKDFLGKIDKSDIGGWDEKIRGLCVKINNLDDYYSLSSCSGRVVLIKDVAKKESGLFLFRTHDKINFKELINEVKGIREIKYKGRVMFKQESCILHVACKDISSAYKLLIKARSCGWMQSGIISIAETGNRVVVDLRSTESLSFPIFDKSKVIVDDKFLKIIVKESNLRLERAWKKIQKLEKSI